MANKHIVIAENGDSSGLTRTYTLAESFFYASQDTVVLDWNCYKAYGTASFINKSYLVSMFYQPQDADGNPLAEPSVIGGYVSPWNIPVFGEFSTDALRIGVKYADVKEAIQDRINFAKNLIQTGGSGDESRFGSTAFLNQSVKILESRLKIINNLLDKGIRICVLSEASRSINYRKKEILDYVLFNQGFFDTFYPSSAFPIGSPLQYAKTDTWIDRDYFAYNLFKLDKEPVIRTDYGITRILPAHQWVLIPIINSFGGWSVKLKIVFQRTPSSKKKSKPTDNPLPPKPPQVLPVDKAAEKVIDGVAPGSGDLSPDDINEANKVAKSIDKGAKELDKSGKDKEAEKYRKLSDDIRKQIINTMISETDKITDKIDSTDVLGRDFEETMEKAIDLLNDFSNLEATGELEGEEYEKSKGKLFSSISNSFQKRAEELAQGHKGIDVDSPDLEGSEQEIINSGAISQITGGEVTNIGFKIIGDKRRERVQKRHSNWEQTDRSNPDFFKTPQWIFEDIGQIQVVGEDDDQINEVVSSIKNKIVNEIRAEINSAATDETKLNELFDLSKKLGLEKSLPIDIFQSYIDKLNDSKPSELVGQGAANLSGAGNVQKIE